ncbi:hypothetical protein QL285_034450 [Trifolium repens]|nr:hypothetical protein QL285_034450 [Trifolium repens]
MVLVTHGGSREGQLQEFSQTNSNLSSSSSFQGRDVSIVNNPKRQKKPLSRLPFSQLVGPKCLRLMEVVNSVSGSYRKKRNTVGVGETSMDSIEDENQEPESSIRVVNQSDLLPRSGDGKEHTQERINQSGVDLIIGEVFGEDELMHDRNVPGSIRLEAEQILEILEVLGMKFNERKNATVERLIELEERDRAELENCQENQGLQ